MLEQGVGHVRLGRSTHQNARARPRGRFCVLVSVGMQKYLPVLYGELGVVIIRARLNHRTHLTLSGAGAGSKWGHVAAPTSTCKTETESRPCQIGLLYPLAHVRRHRHRSARGFGELPY